jgi:hypothetical protein
MSSETLKPRFEKISTVVLNGNHGLDLESGIEIFGDPAVIFGPPFFSDHGSSVIRRGRSRASVIAKNHRAD